MKLDLAELTRLSIETGNINSTIRNEFLAVNNLLNEVLSNVQSTSLTNGTNKFTELISDLSNQMNTMLPELKSFLDKQVDNYRETNRQTKGSIDDLIAFMDNHTV